MWFKFLTISDGGLLKNIFEQILNSSLAPYTVKKPCRIAPNCDADNGGAEPNDVGVGIFRPPHRLVRATDAHIGISRSFFYSVGAEDSFTY
jgi:hypothetical protein